MQVPANWQDVLLKIRAVYPSAIIAGGALRDLLHGKPVKDVDIFIPITHWEDGREFNDSRLTQCDAELYVLDKILEPSPVTIKASSLYGRCNLQREVMAVYNAPIGDTMYEIIFTLQTPEQHARLETTIEQFDLSICQIGYDGTKVFNTPAFNQTLQDKMIRVMNVNRKDRQKKRMARMLAKYPEYFAEEITENVGDENLPF